MPFPLSRCLVVLTTIILAGCERGGSWPNLADVPPEVQPGFQNASTLTPPPAPPPPATAGEAEQIMTRVAGAVTGLGARLDQHRDRFARLQQGLSSQSGRLDADIAAGKGVSSDDWSKAQADLSGFNADVDALRDLREDVAADAAAGAGLVADLEPVGRASLGEAARVRFDGLRGTLDGVLAGLGALDREIGEARESWLAKGSALAARLDRTPPALAGVSAAPPGSEPGRPAVRKPRPKPAAEASASGPRDSGDRFKGRQALVTLTLDDPNLDFEPRLRGLIDKVRAQYPDIAFDIETIGAPPAQLAKVRALLKTFDIPSDVFVTPPKPDVAPVIKLYPR